MDFDGKTKPRFAQKVEEMMEGRMNFYRTTLLQLSFG